MGIGLAASGGMRPPVFDTITACLCAVQRRDRHLFGGENPNQPDLPGRVAPHLGNDGARHVYLLGELQQPHDPAVGALDRDECTGVEY